MSDTVIKVENLSKKYIIGHQQEERYTALRDVIANKVKSLGSFIQNPKFQIQNDSEEFWALKDVSFEIKQGDRVGIIGRNGAGKSTLLKILSRITEPTSGRISIEGRVASLLEVGTGFHPELTGRENIYLNGAILGMSKVEIKRKFDEIVAFAEVERFLDTPVKRYSSGMYVRLAFAVAAHLEPEILIVDEVLAVGDAQFQKKCLGKMEDVGKTGRTVLFVSHQMGMIATLCNHAIVMQSGKVILQGNTKEAISYYTESSILKQNNNFYLSQQARLDKEVCITEVETLDKSGTKKSEFEHTEPITVKVKCAINKWLKGILIGITLKDIQNQKIFTTQRLLDDYKMGANVSEFTAHVQIPANFLTGGQYRFYLALHIPNVQFLDQVDDVCTFSIIDVGSELAMYGDVNNGCVFANCDWRIQPY